MSHDMAVVTDPTTGTERLATNVKYFTEQDAAFWLAEGYSVEIVSYDNYARLSEERSQFEKAERDARHAAMGWSKLKGIAVPLESIPDKGMRVRFRHGECFDRTIEWDDVEDGILVRSSNCNPNGEAGIALLHPDGTESGFGYAGWNSRQKTWWRYLHEAQPGAYREHCMQIISITE